MENKNIKINNKSDKPDNIVLRDHEIIEKCLAYENKLPTFMKDYFIYLKGSVAVSTRSAYLEDIHFFCNYIVNETDLSTGETAKDITLEIEKQVAAYRKENNELSKLESLENEYISQKRNWDDNKNAGAGSEEAKTMASQMSDILRKAIETGIVEETDAGIEAFKRLASSGQASAQQLLDGFNKLGINEDAFSKKTPHD